MLLYKNYRCLYETDYRPEGFRWINANDKDNSVYSFIRISPDNNKHLLFVLSFTPVERNKFRIGAPLKGKYKLVLGSNEDIQKKTLTAVKVIATDISSLFLLICRPMALQFMNFPVI